MSITPFTGPKLQEAGCENSPTLCTGSSQLRHRRQYPLVAESDMRAALEQAQPYVDDDKPVLTNKRAKSR